MLQQWNRLALWAPLQDQNWTPRAIVMPLMSQECGLHDMHFRMFILHGLHTALGQSETTNIGNQMSNKPDLVYDYWYDQLRREIGKGVGCQNMPS